MAAVNARNIGGNIGAPSVGTNISAAADPSKVSHPTTQERGTPGDRDARRAMRRYSGVVEGYPGIIESSHIEPLDDDDTDDEGVRGRTMGQSTSKQPQNLMERAATAAEGTASYVYGMATGDQKAKQAGTSAEGGQFIDQSMSQAQGLRERVVTLAEGTANIVYGTATGDEQAKQAGRKALGLEK